MISSLAQGRVKLGTRTHVAKSRSRLFHEFGVEVMEIAQEGRKRAVVRHAISRPQGRQRERVSFDRRCKGRRKRIRRRRIRRLGVGNHEEIAIDAPLR